MKLKDLITEIGNKGDTFDLEFVSESVDERNLHIAYMFKTLEHDYYVHFDGDKFEEADKFDVECEFMASEKELDELTNENKLLKVIRTVAEITEIVLSKYEGKINKILFYGVSKPSESGRSTTQRAKIYERFFENYFSGRKIDRRGNNVYIYP